MNSEGDITGSESSNNYLISKYLWWLPSFSEGLPTDQQLFTYEWVKTFLMLLGFLPKKDSFLKRMSYKKSG